MTKFTEGRHPIEGLISEGDFHYSREEVTIASGAGVIVPGHVLGKLTASGKYKPSPATGSNGDQVAVAIALYGVDATSADQKLVVVTRLAQWNINTLTYDSSVDDDTKKAAKITQLKAVGIICR